MMCATSDGNFLCYVFGKFCVLLSFFLWSLYVCPFTCTASDYLFGIFELFFYIMFYFSSLRNVCRFNVRLAGLYLEFCCISSLLVPCSNFKSGWFSFIDLSHSKKNKTNPRFIFFPKLCLKINWNP